MTYSPLVSVLMPAYNCDEFIDEAIQSILNQDYNNLEIIIIDDCSTDKTNDIIKKFTDTRIRYIGNKKNLGISECLNILIENSSGKYLCRMDADDIMHPNKISLQMEYMKKNNLDFCGTWIEFFGAEKKIIKYPQFDMDIRFFMCFGSPFAHPSIIFTKEIIKKFKYEKNVAEDYSLWTKIAASSPKIKFGNLQKVMLSYRRHPNQLTSDRTHIINDSILISKFYSKKYILETDIYENLSQNNFGMNKVYNYENFMIISINIINLAKLNNVSNYLVTRFIRSFFNKLSDIKFVHLLKVIKLIYLNKISLFDLNIFFMIVIYFLNTISIKKT